MCLECMDYMQLIDGQCKAWPIDQYYDDTTRLCRDWDGSWIGRCAYREDCFRWPQGQTFSIEDMQCVAEWNGLYFVTSYVAQSDSSIIDMWRPLTYYVNPNSVQNMELGTIDYPFRDINLVLIELHNVHQHSQRNISVYTMEATENYLSLDLSVLLNVSEVTFDA